MKILIDIGHPAHVHYFKNLINRLFNKGHECKITCRDKDVSIRLIKYYNLNYFCTGKNYSRIIGKIYSFIKNIIYIIIIGIRFKPDIIISAFLPFPAISSFFLRKPSIGFTDTEHAIINHFLSKPFTDHIFTPSCFKYNLGTKQIFFDGYMELLYLNPKYFQPNMTVLKSMNINKDEDYIIFRFISWQSSHDIGHSGLDYSTKRLLIKKLLEYGKVYISSESQLSNEFKEYQLNISPEQIHDVLYYAKLFIGEGATMASECAMLGTPAIYVNSLDTGYIREQEKYGLLYSYRNSEGVLEKAIEILNRTDKRLYQKRRRKMLSEKIDVTAFMVWLIEYYPDSVQILKENPDYQYRFK